MLAPDDLPTQPIGYCCFDVVLLAGEGFTLTRRRHHRALVRWVEAGGSVCVATSGRCGSEHVAFLDRLARAGEGPAFFVGPDGELRRAVDDAARVAATFRCGLGRVVVAPMQALNEEYTASSEWREAVGFLWKVRRAQVAEITRGGAWKKLPPLKSHIVATPWQQQENLDDEAGRFSVGPLQVGTLIEDHLMPRRARPVPFGVIVLLLLAFVAVIGPVDYYLLRRLRLQRFTWVTFPCASVLFTVVTVLLSNYYMGTSDQRRTLAIIDVGTGNRVLRKNVFELVVAGTGMTARSEVRGGIFCPMDYRAFGREDMSYYYRMRRESVGENGRPGYRGRVPARYEVSQRLRQWTPQLNRILTIGLAEHELADVAVDFDAIDPFGSRAEVSASLRAAGFRPHDGELSVLHPRSVVDPGNSTATVVLGRASLGVRQLGRISARPAEGFFGLVSQISPTGGANFEDVSLLDASDLGARLVMLCVELDDGFAVYRRLYRRDE
jgi:hypothetical protein